MKRFTVICDFGGTKAPFHIYVGEPCGDEHPLHYQEQWLRVERGGTLPAEVLENFEKLKNIAIENNVSFEELCAYALGTADSNRNRDDSAST